MKLKLGEANLFSQEKVDLAYRCAYAGLTTKNASRQLGISASTYNIWKKKYPEFNLAIEKGRDNRIEEKLPIIEDALFKSAIGYKTKEKITKSVVDTDKDGNETIIKEKIEVREKIVAPNVLAQIFALKNLKKEVYSDKITVDGKLSFVDLMRNKAIEDKNKNVIDYDNIKKAEIIEDDDNE